jgi:hypothetical protein
MRRHWTLFAFLLLTAYTPGAAEAQLEISSRASSIRIGGRSQAQYSVSSVPGADNDFFFRRVRLLADITVNDFVSARIQPDFAGGKAALQDTYIRLAFSSAFRLSVGQFKRAYDLFEMSSSTDLSLIERDARIEGISSCAGVGSVCSYSRLTESLGFAGRDQGVRFEGSSGRVSYQATITNGTGVNVADENDAKSYSARFTVGPAVDVRMSGQVALHDYRCDCDERTGRAKGWGADIEIGGWREGFLLMGAVTGGDNWKILDVENDAATFLAAQVVASYFHAIDSGRLSGIEPLLRVSLGEPDTGVDSNGATVITPGLMLYFEGKNKIGANLDLYSPRAGESELSFKVQTFVYF